MKNDIFVKIIKSTTIGSWYKDKINNIFHVRPAMPKIDLKRYKNDDDDNDINTKNENYFAKYMGYFIVLDEQGKDTNKHILYDDCQVMTVGDKIKKIKKRISGC
jgi:hypothetical protein